MPKSREGRNSRKEKSCTQEVDRDVKAVVRAGVKNQRGLQLEPRLCLPS